MAGFAATDTSGSRGSWRQLTWFVTAVTALINFGVLLVLMGQQGTSVLVRDVVALAIIAVGLTHQAAWLASFLIRRGYGPAFRAVCSAIITLLLTMPVPFVVLLVHCTSGDCL